MMWNDNGWSAGDWIAMSMMMVLFWSVLGALAVWLFRSFRNDRASADAARPLPDLVDEVLAERFARGEIDEEEFTHRRDLLHSARPR